MGRENIPNWDFYIAFQFFRLAAIFHGIKGRVIRGTATNAEAKERATAFPRLARLAVEAISRQIAGLKRPKCAVYHADMVGWPQGASVST